MTGNDGDELGATNRGSSRPDATGLDHDYSLTIEDVANAYAHAGHPRTARTLQRYCVSGHLDCQRRETAWGEKFLIAPYSVSRHLAQIDEISASTGGFGRDESRPAATAVAASEPKDADGAVATNVDKPRLVATRENIRSEGGGDLPPTVAVDGRYIAVLERENSFLRDQIGRKDMQIGELSERARETNFLIKGLQNLVLRLQPGRPEPASVPEPRDGASDGGADAIS